MSGARLPPSNAFSVGQRQPYLNHDAGNHFHPSPNHGAFVQQEKKGIGQEAHNTASLNSQSQRISQEVNPTMRGEEIRNDRLGYKQIMSPSRQDVNFSLDFCYVFFPFHLRRQRNIRKFYPTRESQLNWFRGTFSFIMASSVYDSRFLAVVVSTYLYRYFFPPVFTLYNLSLQLWIIQVSV